MDNKTNFDFITKDEDALANYLFSIVDCGACHLKAECFKEGRQCRQTIREWLSEEHKE